MNLIDETSNNNFTKSIKYSKYEQHGSTSLSVSYNSLFELFLSCFDPSYTLLDKQDKKCYISQKSMSIASEIDENKQLKYDAFNYLPKMKSNIIQSGILLDNTSSMLLYLNDYYNVSTTIYLKDSMKYIKTCDKTRKEFTIMYMNNKWYDYSENIDSFKDKIFTKGEFTELETCLLMDIKTKDIYKKFLKSITNY